MAKTASMNEQHAGHGAGGADQALRPSSDDRTCAVVGDARRRPSMAATPRARQPATNSTPRSAPALEAEQDHRRRGDERHGDGHQGAAEPAGRRLAAGGAAGQADEAGGGGDDADGEAERPARLTSRASRIGPETAAATHHDERRRWRRRRRPSSPARPRRPRVARRADEQRVERGEQGERPQPRRSARRGRWSPAPRRWPTVRSSAEMACCWSSIRVTSSMNQAPSARGSDGPSRPCTSTARPAMHSARSAERGAGVGQPLVGDRRSATARSAPRRRRRSRRRAAPSCRGRASPTDRPAG